MEIINKKISIIGAVRSGLAAAKLAKKLGAIPFVSDSSSKEKLEKNLAVLDEMKIEYEINAHTEKIFDCDFMIVSPGVPENSYPVSEARRRKIKIYSEVEFASWFCKATIISITGTNGKTTTTELVAYILSNCDKKCFTAGNIGIAFSEIVLDLKEDEFVSLETSSFQLDHIEIFKPKISMLLNITPDHLDRYENNFELYKQSKFAAALNQTEDDVFIFNADDSNIQTKEITAKKYSFSLNKKVDAGCYWENGNIYFVDNNKKEKIAATADFIIKGGHNVANAMAAVIVAKLTGCSNSSIEKSLVSFPGVEHRIEFVREFNGIKFYNDSKATNVDSVSFALKSFDSPILLILGGKDKGNDYRQIEDLVRKNVKKIYAIGSSANKVYSFFKDIKEVEYKQSLNDCVEAAVKDAGKGDVVLLSPACASFDMFDNYEHRGKVFKEAVRRL
jgi:UDP-N-acetylmuramoylalanine--D-glutamate ligase